MARKVRTKTGNTITLLNPAEKGNKYSTELRMGKKITNDGVVKKSDNGKVIKLGKKERAYRSGYLDARKDNAKAYKSKRSKKKLNLNSKNSTYNDFDYTPTGRIKGSYNADGFFEPD